MALLCSIVILFLTQVGGVKFVKMTPDNKNPTVHSGIAVVEFESMDAAKNAINVMNGFRIDGRCLQMSIGKV